MRIDVNNTLLIGLYSNDMWSFRSRLKKHYTGRYSFGQPSMEDYFANAIRTAKKKLKKIKCSK
jgi:hypothetical protein